MYETKCLNTKTHGRAYGNRALSEHIYGIWLWVLFGEGLVYPNSPQKNKKTVCNRHAHHDDVIEKQLKLNPASALKKTCHPRGFNKFIPKTSWASESAKERSHSSSSMTNRRKDLRTMGREEQRDQSSSRYPSYRWSQKLQRQQLLQIQVYICNLSQFLHIQQARDHSGILQIWKMMILT